MKKLIHITLLALLAVFLFCAPAAIAHGVQMNIYTLREDAKNSQYQGNIKIWHVVSFKTHGSSGVSFLKARASAFEKSSPYVYLSVEGMTPEEAREKIKNGEAPDVISYPKGFAAEVGSFRSLTLPSKMPEEFAESAEIVPYMYDEYVLCCNEALFTQLGVSLPIGDYMDEDTLLKAMKEAAAQNIKPLTLTQTEYLSAESALASAHLEKDDFSLYSEEELPALSEYDISGDTGEFIAQTSAMYICTRCELANLLESKAAAALSVREYRLGDYTDAVQCVSVLAKGDDTKEEMCERFALSLLKKRAQSGLAELGMNPVLSD